MEVIGLIRKYASQISVLFGTDEEAHEEQLPVLGLADLVGKVRVGLLGLECDGCVTSE